MFKLIIGLLVIGSGCIASAESPVSDADKAKITCDDLRITLNAGNAGQLVVNVTSKIGTEKEVSTEFATECIIATNCSGEGDIPAFCAELDEAEVMTNFVTEEQFRTLHSFDEVRGNGYKERAQGN